MKEDSLTFGICKICRKHKILTEEHIPPKAAFNNGTIKIYSSEENMKTIVDDNRLPWDYEGLKYKLKQGGNRYLTLCKTCNSYTGSNYVNYYQIVVKEFARFLHLQKPDKDTITAYITPFKPLPFFKQVISMFASLTNITENKNLIEFILDKNNNKFDIEKYKVFMSVFNGGINRISGWSVIYTNNKSYLVSEIVSYPFIFVLLGNADEFSSENTSFLGTDITDFSKYKYDEEITIELTLDINECNINFPCDYRTKEEIIECRNLNKKHLIKN